MSEEPIDAELAAIEAALGSLKPAASALQRDRLMFLAGRASAATTLALLPTRRRRIAVWLWPCATALSLAVAVAFAVLRGARVSLPSPSGRGAGGEGTVGHFVATDARKKSVIHSERVPMADCIVARPHPNPLPEGEGTVANSLAPPSPWENRRLCQWVLEHGIDSLPEPDYAPCGSPPPLRRDSYRELLDQVLNKPSS